MSQKLYQEKKSWKKDKIYWANCLIQEMMYTQKNDIRKHTFEKLEF